MRIVYLSGSTIPSRGANSIQVMQMCEAFARNGHETTLIGKQPAAGRSRDAYDYYGVRRNFELALIPCTTRKGVNILILPKLYARLRRYDPREVLIYARDIYGVSLAVRMGFRAIYEAHAAPYNRLIHYLETRLLRSPRLVRLVVISEALKTLYTSRFPIADRTVVCHDAAAMPNGSLSDDLPWPPCRDTLQVGYAGHLYPGKGAEVVVECAKRLPHCDFHIIGGTETDIALWKTRAAANVHFHGFLEPALVHQARARCDVLLMPPQRRVIVPYSHMDIAGCMSPLKLFEYMASRRAIIASDLPVLREVLNEQMAVLVPPDDPDRWVEAIRQCEDRSYRRTLAENAYRAFLEHHTWEKRAQKVLEGIDA